MTSLRQRGFCLTALAVYLGVNVGAGALHHHSLGTQSGRMSPAEGSALQFQLPGSPEDNCDDDACLLCRVLHLARALPIIVRVDAVAAYAGQALPAVAIARPHFLETATHSRAPPLHVHDQ